MSAHKEGLSFLEPPPEKNDCKPQEGAGAAYLQGHRGELKGSALSRGTLRGTDWAKLLGYGSRVGEASPGPPNPSSHALCPFHCCSNWQMATGWHSCHWSQWRRTPAM